MCGKATPFREEFFTSFGGWASKISRRSLKQKFDASPGKPEAFRTSGGIAAATITSFLHSLRYGYSQSRQRCRQLLSSVIRYRDQHGTLDGVLLGDNSVAVIEEIKRSRQVERVLRDKRRFRTARRLTIRIFKTRGEHQERPNLISRLAFENFCDLFFIRLIDQGARPDPVATARGTDLLVIQLSKDRIRTDRGVLAVWPRLALK